MTLCPSTLAQKRASPCASTLASKRRVSKGLNGLLHNHVAVVVFPAVVVCEELLELVRDVLLDLPTSPGFGSPRECFFFLPFSSQYLHTSLASPLAMKTFGVFALSSSTAPRWRLGAVSGHVTSTAFC